MAQQCTHRDVTPKPRKKKPSWMLTMCTISQLRHLRGARTRNGQATESEHRQDTAATAK